jgi:5-methylthioadenosine/S-adenosylhomocysteine deaminase
MPDDQPMDFVGLAKVQKHWMPDKDNLLTLGICSRNLGALAIGGSAAAASRGVLTAEQIKRDWDGARALGLPITMHTSGASPIMALERAGLLGSDVQLVHPLLTTTEERTILRERGVSYSISPQGEARRPSHLGVIQLSELLEAGVKVSLSTDTSAPRAAIPSAPCACYMRCTRIASATRCRSRSSAWSSWRHATAPSISVSRTAPVRSRRASART